MTVLTNVMIDSSKSKFIARISLWFFCAFKTDSVLTQHYSLNNNNKHVALFDYKSLSACHYWKCQHHWALIVYLPLATLCHFRYLNAEVRCTILPRCVFIRSTVCEIFCIAHGWANIKLSIASVISCFSESFTLSGKPLTPQQGLLLFIVLIKHHNGFQ